MVPDIRRHSTPWKHVSFSLAATCRQLYKEVRALVAPVIPDRSGTKFPVLPQVCAAVLACKRMNLFYSYRTSFCMHTASRPGDARLCYTLTSGSTLLFTSFSCTCTGTLPSKESAAVIS